MMIDGDSGNDKVDDEDDGDGRVDEDDDGDKVDEDDGGDKVDEDDGDLGLLTWMTEFPQTDRNGCSASPPWSPNTEPSEASRSSQTLNHLSSSPAVETSLCPG